MSIISNEHTFVPFVSGKSTAFEGQRLAQITFKTVTDKVTKKQSKRDSMCVSVPVLDVTADNMMAMKSHVVAMIHKVQDSIIRDRVIAGNTSVNDEHIAFNAVLEYLDAESEGSRIKGEDVTAWFDVAEGFADKLRVVFADKLGLSDSPSEAETKQVEQQVNQYRACYVALAGGKKMYEPKVAEKLAATIERYCDTAEDTIASKFYTRLTKMAQTQVLELGDAL